MVMAAKMMMMMTNLMITKTASIEIARVKPSQALKHVHTVQSITYWKVTICRVLIAKRNLNTSLMIVH